MRWPIHSFAGLLLGIALTLGIVVAPMNAALDVARDTAVDQAKRLVECKEERDSAILDRQAADEARDLLARSATSASMEWRKCQLALAQARSAKPKGRPPYWFGIEETR